MRNFLAYALTICMLFCLTACGNESTQSPNNTNKLSSVQIGDYIKFGKYEQDNVLGNGSEDIEWLVLKVKDDKALVISKYVLDCQPYNAREADITWETCSLRKWLNSAFINLAFTADERAMIATSTVSAPKNNTYSTNAGNATPDQIFLLSIFDVENYIFYNSDSNDYSQFREVARICRATEYAIANGMQVDSSNGEFHWWLRSPGNAQNYAAFFVGSSHYSSYGTKVNTHYLGVRPAMWINIS